MGRFIGSNLINHDASLAYDLLKNPWTPTPLFKFPVTMINGQNRSVCVREWLSHYPWLSYSTKVEGVLCRPCVLFGRVTSMSDRARNSLGQLVSKPLRSLRNATEYLRDHATAKYHLHSVAQVNEFVNRYLHPAKDTVCWGNCDQRLDFSSCFCRRSFRVQATRVIFLTVGSSRSSLLIRERTAQKTCSIKKY